MARRRSRNSDVDYSQELRDSIDGSEIEDSRLHSVFKIIVILIAIPLITGFLKGLFSQVNSLAVPAGKAVYWGITAYVMMHLFIFEPVDFYRGTQQFVQHVFGFLSPLFKVTYYIVPFWGLVLIGLYFLVRTVFPGTAFLNIFYFLTAFIFTMHIIMVASVLKAEELKGFMDYFFVFVVVVAVNIFFMAINLKLYDNSVSIVKIAQSGIASFGGVGDVLTAFLRGLVVKA